ncbi:MAG: PilZ domain-containing protein [Lachnospiraceae bacterium]|nr:PilZ domain-containing protein [Lachnospiraceae bacterium]MBR1913777.1 PilZ domain-containing protein [Lachnospiraceae bacterium]
MASDERRKNLRHSLSIMVYMTKVEDDGEKIPVEVLDVSRTGIGFYSPKELENGTVYQADITIWTGDRIHAFIEIVRVQQKEEGAIYGGIFVGMPESDWSRIRVYETYQEMGD